MGADAVRLSYDVVAGIDWAIVALSAIVFFTSIAALLYCILYGRGVQGHGFSNLWRTRFCFQTLAAAFAVVQVLRLQVLWGPESSWAGGAWQASALCRVYIALQYGLLEPALLLLALFACVYALQSNSNPSSSGEPGRDSTAAGATASPAATAADAADADGSGSAPPSRSSSTTVSSDSSGTSGSAAEHRPLPPASPQLLHPQRPTEQTQQQSLRRQQHPNFHIVFFALGFTLPCCTAQLVAALFTRIFELDYDGTWLFRAMFQAYDSRQADHCPQGQPTGSDGSSSSEDGSSSSSGCAWCTFPLLSTLITAGFAAALLLGLCVVLRRIASVAVNRVLARRARVLLVLVTVLLVLSIATRGVTVLFEPFDLGFELLRLAHVICSLTLVAGMSHFLVVLPVHDARAAAQASALQQLDGSGTGGSGGVGCAAWGRGSSGSLLMGITVKGSKEA